MRWLRDLGRLARRCPPLWRLTRAVSEPASDPTVAEHLRTCRRCASQHDGLRRLVTLAGTLPPPPALEPKARYAIAARLWGTPARQVPAPRWGGRTTWVAAGAAVPVAALIALGLVALGRGKRPERPAPNDALSSPRSLASIHAFGDARFARVQPPPDEVVQLQDGRIALDIVPLRSTERFRVLTDDAAVEVRGTSFELSASRGHLLTASVSRGRVEVKAGGGLAILAGGDKWERATTTTEPSPPPAPPPVVAGAGPPSTPAKVDPGRARSRPAPRAHDSPTDDSSPGEKAMFARAWSLLRSGNTKAAAVAFAELDEQARGRSIEEDALYWRAVAVARLGDEAAAARLFGDFSRRFPRSGHRGEAAVALGWLLLHAGSIDEARRAFDTATGDPSPVVRASAIEGLRRTKRD
jgi:hypothetical protein